MHIAAYMAALDVDDLDHMAKMALRTVCARANQHTAVAVVSTSRLGADMATSRQTAARALHRAVNKGYLSVDKCLGKTSRWRINLLTLYPAPVTQLVTGPVTQLVTRKDSLEKREGGGARAAQDLIDDCAYCDDHGWLWRDNAVARCSHRPTRAVTDLTVDQLLDKGIDAL